MLAITMTYITSYQPTINILRENAINQTISYVGLCTRQMKVLNAIDFLKAQNTVHPPHLVSKNETTIHALLWESACLMKGHLFKFIKPEPEQVIDNYHVLKP